MNIVNINNCDYSYANAVGIALKQPLFKFISNVAITANATVNDQSLKNLAQLVAELALSILFAIPVGALWMTGYAVLHFSATKINHDGLALAPAPLKVPQEVRNDASIDIMELAIRYGRLKNIEDSRLPGQTSKQALLQRLCDWTVNRNIGAYKENAGKRELFYGELSTYLKGIVRKLNEGNISPEQERRILIELAEASAVCYPTWLTVASKLYAEVHGGKEAAEIKLLRHVQTYKENLILEFSQIEVEAQWHALNYIKNILGEELGLDTVLNEYDPYADNNNAIFGKILCKWLFLHRYENVNRLIAAIHTMISEQPYDESYAQFLINIIKQQGIENPEAYVSEHFYDDNGINKSAINLMLRSLGILK